MAPTSVQESGWKGDSRGGREPEVEDLRNQRQGVRFLDEFSPFLDIACGSLLSRFTGHSSSSARPSPRGQERVSFTTALENDFIIEMHELLFTKNILLFPKEVLCEGLRTRLAVYEPVKHAAHSP